MAIGIYSPVDIMDPRDHLNELEGASLWRARLRRTLYEQRNKRSDLTQIPLAWGFQMHESIFSRKYVSKQNWQNLLFCGINCLLISPAEHIPFPPSREVGYWLAVVRYGKEIVDLWIKSLPFKSTVSTPWKDSNGAEVLARIPDKYKVDKSWYTWYGSVYRRVNVDG